MNAARLHIIGAALVLLIFGLLLPLQGTAAERNLQASLGTTATAITTLSVSDAEALYEKGTVLFLDVREPAEFGQGHIPGAVNIPMKQVEEKITRTASDKDTPILIYCRSGRRSALVTAELMKKGYTHLMNMGGGINEWSKAGYPVE